MQIAFVVFKCKEAVEICVFSRYRNVSSSMEKNEALLGNYSNKIIVNLKGNTRIKFAACMRSYFVESFKMIKYIARGLVKFILYEMEGAHLLLDTMSKKMRQQIPEQENSKYTKSKI